MLPVSHNVDSFGYRTDMLPKGLDINKESWSWLMGISVNIKVLAPGKWPVTLKANAAQVIAHY
ncbi:hypothetical protein AAGW18_22185 [Vreelandella titanicae]|jgi:hypothetical protein|uniref:hypothetical protein n=1 Tax=Vreelandella titanicae TaxID=664683 RepID=UPI00058751B0|nr:hypothetical protein [Halomonas titanicae]NVE88924.1 hypothetical protein [Halomonas titanicae]QNU64022.1 hypothetical protein HZS52_06690 [Halomonas titanicae]UEQ03842.1 hypothetical protein LMS44_21615 [Halomonas profundus]|tara:strand:- start:469 stop:657 length:189 start_codon:yes stop_codon:yes gene_type:complete